MESGDIMRKSNQLKKWNDEALNYIAKLKSKLSHIKLSNFVRAYKFINKEENMLNDIFDITSMINRIDNEITFIYKNLTTNNKISKLEKTTTDMSAKDAIRLAIKLYKVDLKKACNLSYYKDGKTYLKYMKKDKDGVVYRNINRLYELRERRGTYILEYVYSIYKELPRILRFERGE